MATSPSLQPPRRSPARALLGALASTGLDAVLLAAALGGFGALGHHHRALALLALWGAGSIVLAWLRPVRTHDPVELRREPPLVLIAFFVIPLLTPPLSALGERLGIAILPGGPALRWMGVALSAAGFATRIAAMGRLGSRFSPFVAVQRSHALETSGVYAWVRHPGYLGSWLTLLGAVLAFGSALTLPLALAMLWLFAARTRREEEVLERHFPDEYPGYRDRTGAFVPRLRFSKPRH